MQQKGAVRGTGYHVWDRSCEERYPGSRGRCERQCGGSPAAASGSGREVLFEAAACADRDGGLRVGALLGPGAVWARPRPPADAGGVGEGVPEARQEHWAGRGGVVGGGVAGGDIRQGGGQGQKLW